MMEGVVSGVEGGTSAAWQELFQDKVTDTRRAFRELRRGQRIFIGSGCGEPQYLVRALEEHLPKLADLEILHILSLGKHTFLEESYHDKCRLKSFFVAAASREAVAEGRADYTPVNLVDVPKLFRSGVLPIDVALIQVSEPDQHGFCSLGISVDIVKAAAESARFVIAQINGRMPRTLGDSFIHVSDLDALIPWDEPLLEMPPPPINDVAKAIGAQVAKLIEDGSTLRVGVGSVPSAVLYALEDKKDLGVHTDMLTDPYVDLVEKGVITNARKTLHPGKIIASFCLGTKKLYDFVHNNPMVAFHPVEYTNNYLVISQNEKMVTLNSALEVDLTGQVCSDSVGYQIYSGVGGSVDFLRGARNSRGGKAIVVLPSTTLDGQSRIVPELTEGGGVVTTRGGVQYVVTEYGIAQLQGRSLRERALALIGIAHPDFREDLTRHAYRMKVLRRELFAISSARAIYPENLEVSQVFDEETRVFFRPAKPTDERLIREFFYSLPKDESYIRFLSTMKVYPQVDVNKLINIDYEKEMTLVGLVGDMEAERVVAVGRYVVDEETLIAEVDFAVHPDYGRKGIASFMIQYLSEIAKKSGVRQFRAYISAGNERVFGVFQKLGYFMESSFMEGLYEIRVHFDRTADACLTERPE
ncbi:Acyl-CoA hydrolase [Desulfacinum infernum DSM 9756]|uniref:Acyl-CoA hydrolase n=1 Tax=Desulfacinum infernum DSM 9756 TaxID=1121391 RepID=A0A1M4WAQ3_9BACT|nr:GNAT family N-acetyltransferase [Desulfacinum infernum]SHE78163.1 Acyl-CoA hydrolase [Desulfacinum infernum DSM 9756]